MPNGEKSLVLACCITYVEYKYNDQFKLKLSSRKQLCRQTDTQMDKQTDRVITKWHLLSKQSPQYDLVVKSPIHNLTYVLPYFIVAKKTTNFTHCQRSEKIKHISI